MVFYCLPLRAENIGDFAPLVAGNVWVYDDVSSSGVMSAGTLTDSIASTITLKESVLKGDTVYHYFEINSTTTHIISRLGKTKSSQITTESSTDTALLMEIDNTILAKGSWPVSSPVFTRHFIDTSDTTIPLGEINSTFYKLKNVNGVFEYSINSPSRLVAGMMTGSRITTYRQNVGYVYYSSYSSSNPGVSTFSKRKVRLSSFSGASSVTPVLTPTSRVKLLPQQKTATTSLGFPCLFIVNKGMQFNLLGRLDRGPAGVIQQKPQLHRKYQ